MSVSRLFSANAAKSSFSSDGRQAVMSLSLTILISKFINEELKEK